MKSKRFLPKATSAPRGYHKSNKVVQPLSYYVSGGVDVDGTALKKDARTMADAESDDDTWMSMFGRDSSGDLLMFADPFTDPRHDVFSLSAMASDKNFRKVVRKAMTDSEAAAEAAAKAAAKAAASASDSATQ